MIVMINIRHRSKGSIYIHSFIQSSTQLELGVLLALFYRGGKTDTERLRNAHSHTA